MRLSYIIISHNRQVALRKTLSILPTVTPLPASEWDVWVVDNGSTDGTPEMVYQEFPKVNVIRLSKNVGMPARNAAFGRATGDYFITLDDDSYPQSGNAVTTSLRYMDGHPSVAALVARVELLDGSPEAPAMPTVLLGGASVLRASAIKKVGGFAREFFRQAEEYELSCRIWSAGYRIERFEDIVFKHEKVAGPGRASALVHRMDMRNNLIVAERFLPQPLRRMYRGDWSQRYGAMAAHAGYADAAQKGRWGARVRRIGQAIRGRKTMPAGAIEQMFGFERQHNAVQAWADANCIQNVCIADFSKNVFATMNACVRAGLNVRAVLDDNPAFTGLRYRGVPILPLDAAAKNIADGVVLSNTNPAQIDQRMEAVRAVFNGPALRLWEPKYLLAGGVQLRRAA